VIPGIPAHTCLPRKSSYFLFVAADGSSAIGIVNLMITGAEIRDPVLERITKQLIHLLPEIAPGFISASFLRNHFSFLSMVVSLLSAQKCHCLVCNFFR